MRRTTTIAALTAGLLLTACGGGDDDEPTAPGTAASEAPAASSSGADDREEALTVAAQGYVSALLKGNIAGVVGYLDPQVCDDADEGSYALSVGPIKENAEGATMKITSVYVEGDRGGVDGYELSKGAPDALRRSIKSSFGTERTYPWNYRGGEWYLAGPCKDESASPEPTG